MQTMINLDDALLRQASALAGIDQPGPLIHFALQAMIDHPPHRDEVTSNTRAAMPFVIVGPFAESRQGIWEDRSPMDALTDVDDLDFMERKERIAHGAAL